MMLAVGLKAKAMQRASTPEPIELVRPMRDGVIADFIATEEMLRQFIAPRQDACWASAARAS